MWISDMFKGIDSIRQDCTVAPPPGMTAAAQQSLLATQNLCTSSRSGEAQAAQQALAAGLVIGVVIGHFLWKQT